MRGEGCCLVLAAVAGLAAGQCSVLNPTTGNTIELTSLMKNPFYSVPSKIYDSYKFVFNVCGSITYTDSNNPELCPQGLTSTCEIQTINGEEEASESYGKVSTGSWTWNTGNYPEGVSDPGPLYKTTNGECTRSGDQSTVTSWVYLVCDPSATTPTPEMIEDNYWECYVKIILRTDVACGDTAPPGGQNGDEGESTDIGMILCILFFVGGTVYLAGGVAYNMKVKQLEKYDAIPNKEFWQSLPGLISAGFEFTKVKTKEAWEKYRGNSGGYSEL